MSPKKKTNINDIDGFNVNDPLDYLGNDNNFLNDEPFSAEYKGLAEKWSVLPLYENKKEIKNFINSLNENQVTLVISGTGSGKTVLIPKFTLKYLMKKYEKPIKIAITNPKKLTTIYNAEYSAQTLDVKLGDLVGYKFRGAPENMNGDNVRLLYSTDGLLLSQLLKDKLLSAFDCVIIDEAHERQVPIDLLLYFLKDVIKQRPEFKLIIMSATIDLNIFKTFYEKDKISFGSVSISGQSNFPITSIWMQPNDKINMYTYMDVGIAIILKLLEEDKGGDILMFVTSQKETEIGCNKLKMLCEKQIKVTDICDQYYCAEVYSKMSDDDRELAVNKDKYQTLNSKYKRKIIFATNVAESSITLDGVVYVIDTGLELLSYNDYIKVQQVIEKRYTTQAQIKQRMGRAGRTKPGICYHLYTEDKFNKLEQFPSPSIALSNMNDHFLSFIRYQVYLSEAIELCKNLITPVKPDQIMSAIRFLHFHNIVKIIRSPSSTLSGSGSGSGSGSKSDEEGFSFEFSDSDSSENIFGADETDEMDVAEKVNFKQISYKNMLSYDAWSEFQGGLTRFGKIVQDLNGYPMELAILGFYGKMLNIGPMIYSMISIIAAMDYKLDNLIRYPSGISFNEKSKFINDNFPDAIVDYSEHMFLYNLLTNYFELGKIDMLNVAYFDKATEIKNIFAKVLERIKDEDIVSINQKYELISEELLNSIESYSLLEKIYIAIFLAYRYNTIRLVDTNKITYQTQNYIENTTFNINFNFGKQLTSNNANDYSWGVCTNLSNVMGRLFVNGCTLLPKDLSNKIMKYF